ncbi:MAG TPA: TNT domain-containing protein [Actinophytocola sp.]|uniref:TNT domain-containing protein n=1 Tax=Actinophytocola sp. TaxID=1872138 RepID=UPI002DB8A7A0|nr:TNT domain-containing protein [Actinophytocola sp.]HEU5473930.1 TNT domain-containing protein [Actinophytocola sp.]
MVQTTQLDSTEQDALVKQIGLAVLRSAPEGWDQVTVYYRAVGRYFEADGEVVFADDEATEWQVPGEITGMFARLRAGMYRDGRGTWYNAKYRLDHPSNYNLDYDRNEPEWRVAPPPPAYADDLRMFPRSDDNVPDWLRWRAGGAVTGGMLQETQPRFRMARVFDGAGSNGRPIVNRPPIGDDERTRLLNYLNNAPTVLQSRSMDLDRLDPEGRPLVPVGFHTDGTWVWAEAVNYYLNTYKVSPEPDLVDHIRRRGFRVLEVDEPTRAAATAFVSRPVPPAAGPARPAAPPSPPSPPPPPPPPPPPQPQPQPQAQRRPGPPAPPPAAPEVTMAVPRVSEPPARPAPPPAALPSQGPPGVTIDALRGRLAALGVPASAFRIGPPGERAWTMEQTPEGWRVGWYDRDFVAPAMFEDVADAAAFLLGKIMLDNTVRPEPIAPVPPPAPPAAPAPLAPVPPSAALPVPRPATPPPPPVPVAPPPPVAVPLPDPATPPELSPPTTFMPAAELDPDPEPDAEATIESAPVEPPPAEPQPTLGVPMEALLDPPSEPSLPPVREPVVDRTFSLFEPQVEPQSSDLDDPRFAPWSNRHVAAEPAVDPLEALVAGEPRHAEPDSPPPVRPDPTPVADLSAALNVPPVEAPALPSRLAPAPLPAEPPPPPALPPAPNLGPVPPPAAPAMAAEPDRRPGPIQQRWPIQPRPGEPPLTLFRGKRMMELAPGTEIDRFGDPDGNLTFVAGTPFGERSLVPDWIERPFHTYRVARPMRVLTGISIPWFDQIGGGTAYLLPEAIKDLVADGRLVEVHRHKPPN